MSGSFLKGVAVGAVCILVGGVATVALAGSGVGGVFNLGVSNSVDAQTSLSGSTNTPQLHVANTNAGSAAAGVTVNSKGTSSAAVAGGNSSSGPGVTGSSSSGAGVSGNSTSGPGVFGQSSTAFGVSALTASATQPALQARNTGGGPAANFGVNAGKAPFTVSSQTKVTNLNADMLDGLDVSQIMSGDGRIAQALGGTGLLSLSPWTTQVTATLTAPSNGFVLAEGSVTAADDFSSPCHSCSVRAHIHDVSADVYSWDSFASIGNGTDGYEEQLPVTYVFPVTAGTHSYTLDTSEYDYAGGPAGIYNAILTVEFVPFGHDGGSTLAQQGQTKPSTVSPPTKAGVARSS